VTTGVRHHRKDGRRLDANNDKFAVLWGTLISRMDIHQEKMEVAIHSIWSKIEIIKHRVEDVLSCVDQKTQGLHKELTEKFDETQVDLQAVKTSLVMWTKRLQETLADTRNDLHEELGLML
jgi:hypothetical protein